MDMTEGRGARLGKLAYLFHTHMTKEKNLFGIVQVCVPVYHDNLQTLSLDFAS